MLVFENTFWGPAPYSALAPKVVKSGLSLPLSYQNLPSIRVFDKIEVYFFLTFKKLEDAPRAGGVAQSRAEAAGSLLC